MMPGVQELGVGGTTDAALIRRSVHEPLAFEGVFGRHFDTIHRYLARRVGAELADELAAETFATAFAQRRRYDDVYADARPWLYGIAVRLLRRHRRTEQRQLQAFARTGVDPAAPDHGPEAASAASASAAGPALAAAIATLEPAEREVLLLFAWAELSYVEIAHALAIPVGTVRSRLSRARRRVRVSLALPEVHDVPEEVSHG